MSRYVLDIETDGLLDELTKVNCLALLDIDTGELHSFADQPGHRPIEDGLFMAAQASLLIGHKILTFDIPAIEKCYPGWKDSLRVWGNPDIRDTLILVRVLWPNIAELDGKRRAKHYPDMPGNMVGRDGLKAWGFRLGEHKGDYKGGWDAWSPEMHAYMCQDVRVTLKLWQLILTKHLPELTVEIEHRFAEIIFLQEQHGFCFDVPRAHALHARLVQRRLELETELQQAFPAWWIGTEVSPTRTVRIKRPEWGMVPRLGKRGNVLGEEPVREVYTEGCPYSKLERVTFNPASRAHIADRLKAIRGWRPKEFTDGGDPKVDETVLAALSYPEAKLLNEYLMLEKRIGALADGNNAWLRCERNGRIHGEVNTCGTASARCTHSKPNISQVPSVHNAEGPVPFGRECRELFIASPGYVLVGADASGIQMRCLAHYLAKWDDGEFGRELIGGDVHAKNATITDAPDRECAKRIIYALILGAGDAKLGSIADPNASRKKQRERGKDIRAKLMAGIPGFDKLAKQLRKRIEKDGNFAAIDGRILPIRSAHSALSFLLQSAEAVAVKLATIILYDTLIAKGWRHGVEWAFVAHVHDEIQAEVLPHLVDEYGAAAIAAIEEAGKRLGFRCPLTGAFKAGASWAETH